VTTQTKAPARPAAESAATCAGDGDWETLIKNADPEQFAARCMAATQEANKIGDSVGLLRDRKRAAQRDSIQREYERLPEPTPSASKEAWQAHFIEKDRLLAAYVDCGGDIANLDGRTLVPEASADWMQRETAGTGRVKGEAAGEGGARMILLTKASNMFGFGTTKEFDCFLSRHPNVRQDRPPTEKGLPHQRRRRVDLVDLVQAISRDDAIMSDPGRRARMQSRIQKAELDKALESETMAYLGPSK
jgi:hypothetical protein